MIRLPEQGLQRVEPGPFKAESLDIKVLSDGVEAVHGSSWEADIKSRVIPVQCFGLNITQKRKGPV